MIDQCFRTLETWGDGMDTGCSVGCVVYVLYVCYAVYAVREVGGGTAHGQLCPMGGLGVVLDGPGRQSGLRERPKEPLGASRKPREDYPPLGM